MPNRVASPTSRRYQGEALTPLQKLRDTVLVYGGSLIEPGAIGAFFN